MAKMTITIEGDLSEMIEYTTGFFNSELWGAPSTTNKPPVPTDSGEVQPLEGRHFREAGEVTQTIIDWEYNDDLELSCVNYVMMNDPGSEWTYNLQRKGYKDAREFIAAQIKSGLIRANTSYHITIEHEPKGHVRTNDRWVRLRLY